MLSGFQTSSIYGRSRDERISVRSVTDLPGGCSADRWLQFRTLLWSPMPVVPHIKILVKVLGCVECLGAGLGCGQTDKSLLVLVAPVCLPNQIERFIEFVHVPGSGLERDPGVVDPVSGNRFLRRFTNGQSSFSSPSSVSVS